jgi:hypothetical protein
LVTYQNYTKMHGQKNIKLKKGLYLRTNIRITLPHHFVKLYQKSRHPKYVVTCITYQFVSRVRKIAKSDYYLRHVCLPVRTKQLGPQSTDLHDI